MPRYEVTVQGRGIVLRLPTETAVGFLRIVHVRAGSPVEAERVALRMVRQQRDASDHAAANQGASPYLTIDSVGVLSLWQRLLIFNENPRRTTIGPGRLMRQVGFIGRRLQ